MKAEASLYLDELRPQKDGLCPVKIKIYFDRKRKYIGTDIALPPQEFEAIFPAKDKRRSREQKEIYTKLESLLNKANDVINDLPNFSFALFEEKYFENRDTKNSVSFAFEQYRQELISQNRLSSAESYRSTQRSLEHYKKNLTFTDINADFLAKFEKWMLSTGKSKTTVGIYARNIRVIFNRQNIDASLYPFGEGKKKYSIPTGRNVKKSLTVEDIAKIYNHEIEPRTAKDMARDYWIFLYLANGMNVKDFCLLKWSNIEGESLTYFRAKTARSKKTPKPILAAIRPEMMTIIKKWGQPSLNKNSFIFPHLNNQMSQEYQHATYRQLTKTINKYMKRISSELGLEKEVTTYFARHSFATVLKRSGASIELISELLGHSNVGVTENYLGSFEIDFIREQTKALTEGLKAAN